MSSCNHKPKSCVEIVPIFDGLNADELMEIVNIAHAKRFEKGTMIYSMGDINHALYVLYEGKIKITRTNSSGKEQVIRVLGPGEFLGEFALFSEMELNENAEVIETATVCVIQSDEFRKMVEKHPSISFKIFDVLSRRLEKAEQTIEDISLKSVNQRISEMLLKLFDEEDTVKLPMNKGDIASQLGMSKESFSRKLTELENMGIIEQRPQKMIHLKDRSNLERLLEN